MKRQVNSGSFKKGQIPWNKGRHGQVPWNKDLTKENDERVAKYSKTLSKVLTGRKGKSPSEDVKRLSSERMKRNNLAGKRIKKEPEECIDMVLSVSKMLLNPLNYPNGLQRASR